MAGRWAVLASLRWSRLQDTDRERHRRVDGELQDREARNSLHACACRVDAVLRRAEAANTCLLFAQQQPFNNLLGAAQLNSLPA